MNRTDGRNIYLGILLAFIVQWIYDLISNFGNIPYRSDHVAGGTVVLALLLLVGLVFLLSRQQPRLNKEESAHDLTEPFAGTANFRHGLKCEFFHPQRVNST